MLIQGGGQVEEAAQQKIQRKQAFATRERISVRNGVKESPCPRERENKFLKPEKGEITVVDSNRRQAFFFTISAQGL